MARIRTIAPYSRSSRYRRLISTFKMYSIDDWLIFSRLWLIQRAFGENLSTNHGQLSDYIAKYSLITKEVPLTTPVIFMSDETLCRIVHELQYAIDFAHEYSIVIETIARRVIERDRLHQARNILAERILYLRKLLMCNPVNDATK